jgi:hypothetical protein
MLDLISACSSGAEGWPNMSVPPSNVKVYDRPERKAPSPIVIAVILLVVVIVGFFLYRAMHHTAPISPANARPGVVMLPSIVLRCIDSSSQGLLSTVKFAP